MGYNPWGPKESGTTEKLSREYTTTSTETTKPVSDFRDEDLHRSLAIHFTLCFRYCHNISV